MNGNTPPTAVFIVVANEPRMLREMLVCVLANSTQMVVIEQPGELLLHSELLQQAHVDWVIVSAGVQGTLPSHAKVLLERLPTVSLLTIALDGSQIIAWIRKSQQELQRKVYDDLSLAQLKALLSYRFGDAHLPLESKP